MTVSTKTDYAHFDAALRGEVSNLETLNAWNLPEDSRFDDTMAALLARERGESMILITPESVNHILKTAQAHGAEFDVELLKNVPGDTHAKFTRI